MAISSVLPRCPSLRRPTQRITTVYYYQFVVLLVVVVSSLLLQEADATSMSLQLASKSNPFCSGALTLQSVQVACAGTNGECYFGTKIRVYGSILANKQLTNSATLGVTAYIDGLVSRDLGYTDDVNLCNYMASIYDDETCPSVGLYKFDVSYTIPHMDDSSGWWFGYNNKIGVNVDVTDSATDGTQFAATCHIMLVVTELTSFNSNDSSTRQSRLLYWSLLGMAAMTGGFYIGYSVRRKCRVVCLEDLNCMVDDDHDDGEGELAGAEVGVVQTEGAMSSNTENQKIPSKRDDSRNTDQAEIIVHSAKFEILQNHPLGRIGFAPSVTTNYLQPPSRKQPLLNPMEHMESVGVQV